MLLERLDWIVLMLDRVLNPNIRPVALNPWLNPNSNSFLVSPNKLYLKINAIPSIIHPHFGLKKYTFILMLTTCNPIAHMIAALTHVKASIWTWTH